MKFGTDVQYHKNNKLLTFERSRSNFKVKTVHAEILPIVIMSAVVSINQSISQMKSNQIYIAPYAAV